MKKWISNILSVLWFFGVLVWMLLILPFAILMLPMDISTILESGFSTQTIGFIILLVLGLVFSITMFVPAFRKCFDKLPWLFPYIIILTADVTILSIGIEILNFGYQTQNDSRHTIFLVIMILQIVLCRIAMCIYCHKKPIKNVRDNNG